MVKKNEKNGFTLVELLASIVILAIIAALAISSYGKVSINVKQKAFENLKTHIETKAEDYASDTGNLITNVDELVKKGYLEGDDEEGNVKNPIDGAILNCHIVSIVEENSNLYGQYSEEEECDLNNIAINNLNVGIKSYETENGTTKGNEIEAGKWTNKNVILEATIGEKINESDIASITWQSNAIREEREINNNFAVQKNYLVEAEQIINTTYEVVLKMKDGTNYQASILVKIDKQRPIIYEIKVEKEEEWTNTEKQMTITASDGNGSGIYGYYIGTNANCASEEYEINDSNSYSTKKDEGTYYVCVKDKAGNLAEDVSTKTKEIKKVDKEAPSCNYTGESTAWTKENRTISLTCADTKSGCVNQNSITKTYTSNTKTEDWNYTIEDNAGNQTVCSKVVDVYVDKCTQTTTSCGNWSSCSSSCGGGYQSRSCSVISTFGSGFTCSSYNDSTSCNTSPCVSSGGSGSGEGYSCKADGSTACYGICGFGYNGPDCCTYGSCPF